MNEQRKDIVAMLAEGKITAEEAERLITAVEGDQPLPASSPGARPKGKAKYLRLMVHYADDGEPGRINVRVPLQLLRAGVQLTALIPPIAIDRANAQMQKAGVPFDLGQLKPEQLEALVDHLDELTVEVDGPDGQVRVFCE